MNNNLITKEVNFQGDSLMCVQDETTGRIYVGVRWVCNGIGLTRGQINNEVIRVQSDFVLKLGCMKFRAGVFDANNETIALEINTMPLWIAKIPITPKILKENKELANKLVNYQLKAKDVLADAFVKPHEINLDNFQIPSTLSEALLLSANLAKQNEEMKPKAEQFDLYLTDEGTLSLNQTAKALKTRRNKMMEFLRYKKILNQDNSPSSYCSDKGYFEVKNFTYVIKECGKFQVAITKVTPTGQNFLYRYLTKYIDEYSEFDPEFKNKISEVQKYESVN